MALSCARPMTPHGCACQAAVGCTGRRIRRQGCVSVTAMPNMVRDMTDVFKQRQAWPAAVAVRPLGFSLWQPPGRDVYDDCLLGWKYCAVSCIACDEQLPGNMC
jgi:hypothetical protein